MINEALADLHETIREDGFSDGLVETIAKDYDVRPELLARLFEQKHGRAPADYKVASRADLKKTEEAFLQEKIEDAISAAKFEMMRYRGGGDLAASVLGKVFDHETGGKMVAVCVSSRGLIAVRVRDGEIRKIGLGRSAFACAEKYGLI